MCEVCRMSHCHPRCPNAPEPPKFDVCIHCGYDILVGDDYYDIDGEYWCENCIDYARKTAEVYYGD